MDITGTGNKPHYCTRCHRRLEDAVKQQVERNHVCRDDKCTFKKEIAKALRDAKKKKKFTITPVNNPPKFTITPLI